MSWEELIAIHSNNQDVYEEWLASDPVSCPNDGTPLQEDNEGNLFCVHDGWVWDGSPYSKGQS